MLNVENVTKLFSDFSLRNINLSLPEGYIMGLIGPNGAGKTTLIHLIIGLYQSDSGIIKIGGKTMGEDEKGIKDKIGTVLAEDLFISEMTLMENGDSIGKYYSHYNKEQLKEYLINFELKRDKKYKHLSRGEKMKFQFAFALSHAPELLILDEPSANFDPEFKDVFMKIITQFVSDGRKSVILSTHIMEDLEQAGDYIAFLNHGRLEFCLDRAQLEDRYRLVSGDDYKINLLPADSIVFKEKTSLGSKALIRHGRFVDYDNQLQVEIPSIEDIMYFEIKGGERRW